jgi:hypothetical protein
MGKVDYSHIVVLIGDVPDGNISKTRQDYPNLDIRASHSDFACLHCGQYFPVSKCMPIGLEMYGVIAEQFRKEHAECEPDKKSKWVVAKE